MTEDFYTPDERRLLECWLGGRDPSIEDENLLTELGFDHDPGGAYTRLDAWVGAFAVQDIQTRLPNCGIGRSDGSFILTRQIRKGRERKVTGVSRYLFRMNWADSGPGISWPVEYNLVWLPGYDRWALVESADCPDAFGYCDFALGAIGVDDNWCETVRTALVNDWRYQFNEWDQAPWACLLSTGLVSEQEAMAWRAEAWRGHEAIEPDQTDEDELEEDEEVLP